MPDYSIASTMTLLVDSIDAPAVHMVLILTLLFAVVMLRVDQRDP